MLRAAPITTVVPTVPSPRRCRRVTAHLARRVGRSSDLQASHHGSSRGRDSYWPSLPNSHAREPVLGDGGRSCLPLRGSPGFSPGSLLRRSSNGANRRMDTISGIAEPSRHQIWILVSHHFGASKNGERLFADRGQPTGTAERNLCHGAATGLYTRRGEGAMCVNRLPTTSCAE